MTEFGIAGLLASTKLSQTEASRLATRGSQTSTSTSTSEASTLAFPDKLLRSMTKTVAIASSGGSIPSSSTFKYTPAGAVAIEQARQAGSSSGPFDESAAGAIGSLLAPGIADIASVAAGTSGLSGLLVGSGSVYSAYLAGIEERTSAGSGIAATLEERASGRLSLSTEFARIDPRTARATARGEPLVADEESETFEGLSAMILQSDEKPAILGVVEENFQSNGTPEQITLVIKKLNSRRFRAIEYIIFKKSIFTDSSYDDGTILPGTGLSTRTSPRYTAMAIEAGFSLPDILTYTDLDIEPGHVYAYKIKCRYDGDVAGRAEDQAEADSMIEAILGSAVKGSSLAAFEDPVFGSAGGGVMTESALRSLGLPTGDSGGTTTPSSSGRAGVGLVGF